MQLGFGIFGGRWGDVSPVSRSGVHLVTGEAMTAVKNVCNWCTGTVERFIGGVDGVIDHARGADATWRSGAKVALSVADVGQAGRDVGRFFVGYYRYGLLLPLLGAVFSCHRRP